MKNRLWLLLLFTLYNCMAHAQEKQSPDFILKGSFTGKQAHAIYLTYEDENGKKIERKAYIKNGAFLFRGFISSPVYGGIMSDIKIKPNGPDVSNYTDIFLSPGKMTVSLKENDFEHAVIKGSKMQDDWYDLINQQNPIQQNRLALYHESEKIASGGNTPKNHKAVVVIGKKIDSCNEIIKQADYRFLSTHTSSYLSAYMLNNYIDIMPLDSIETYYNAFSQPVKNSIAGLHIRKNITYRKASSPGSMAPLFTTIDINERTFDLKSFRHKNYIILEFWASWCQCDDNPHLKDLYTKYHAKGLEIVGVSTDFRKSDWKDTIRKHATGIWYHILEGSSQYGRIQQLYNISRMPPSTIFLIDKEGKIIGRYYGSINQEFERDIDEGTIGDLDKKLAEVFENNQVKK